MNNDIRALTIDEFDTVSGGMKWTRNTGNDDVIGARDGQLNLLGIKITFDIYGNVSSVTT